MAKKAQRAKGQDARPPEPFAHPAEAELARILDFYGIRWEYEPHSFPLRWEGDRVVEAFTPDFYLPDLDLYVEVTTLRGGLNTEKNRKVRLLRQLYPQVRVKLLKRRDVFRLLAKYGYGPLGPDDMPELDRVLIPPQKLQERVAELAKAIEEDYRHLEPVLVGVLRGVICFMADLMRQLTIPITVDFLAISSYGQGGAVRILKDLDEDVRGRHVLLVEDIVDTGITLRKVSWTSGPAVWWISPSTTWASRYPMSSWWATASTSASVTATSPSSPSSSTISSLNMSE
jgi:bifunctional protein TilS/HprT